MAWIFVGPKRNLSVERSITLLCRGGESSSFSHTCTWGWMVFRSNGTFFEDSQSQGILFGHLEFNSGNVRWIYNIPGTDRVITEEVTCFKFYLLLLWLLFDWVFTSLYIIVVYCHDIVQYSPYILHFCGWFRSYNFNQHETCHRWTSGWWAKALDAATGHDKPNA